MSWSIIKCSKEWGTYGGQLWIMGMTHWLHCSVVRHFQIHVFLIPQFFLSDSTLLFSVLNSVTAGRLPIRKIRAWQIKPCKTNLGINTNFMDLDQWKYPRELLWFLLTDKKNSNLTNNGNNYSSFYDYPVHKFIFSSLHLILGKYVRQLVCEFYAFLNKFENKILFGFIMRWSHSNCKLNEKSWNEWIIMFKWKLLVAILTKM